MKSYKEMCREMYMNSKEAIGNKLLFDWTDEDLETYFEKMYEEHNTRRQKLLDESE